MYLTCSVLGLCCRELSVAEATVGLHWLLVAVSLRPTRDLAGASQSQNRTGSLLKACKGSFAEAAPKLLRNCSDSASNLSILLFVCQLFLFPSWGLA